MSHTTSIIETIGPEMARLYMQRNVHNRPLQANELKKLSRALREGRWQFDGSPIRFDVDGRLLDGQHRLTAVITTGIPIETLVVRGLPSSVFTVMDTGKARSPADVLAMAGVKNYVIMASAIRTLLALEGGGEPDVVRRVSNDEILEALHRYPGLNDSIEIVYPSKHIVGPSIPTAMHYLFAKRDRGLADTFFARFADGSNLGPTEPVFLLRERLLRDRGPNQILKRRFIMAAFIKAWNATRRGRTISLLRMQEGEAFPVIE